MIRAAQYAREHDVPYLGLCLGMQVLVIEFARHLFQSREPNSTEFGPAHPISVIDILPEQKDVSNKGGTMRLGVYPCQLARGRPPRRPTDSRWSSSGTVTASSSTTTSASR